MIHTITCPECLDSQEVDLPEGQRATLQHQQQRSLVAHRMRVRPRVMPIHRPRTLGDIAASMQGPEPDLDRGN